MVHKMERNEMPLDLSRKRKVPGGADVKSDNKPDVLKIARTLIKTEAPSVEEHRDDSNTENTQHMVVVKEELILNDHEDKYEAEDTENTELNKILEMFMIVSAKNENYSARVVKEEVVDTKPSLPMCNFPSPLNIPEGLLRLECALSEQLRYVKFNPPVEYVYNPTEYAFGVHSMYVYKYCQTTKPILFLGMNPGPWGMSQTGVPFGEVMIVRDWLKIYGLVGTPDREQPNRLVTGFACPRREVSGNRFWSLFRDLCGEPENFFRHAYVRNYCPLALMGINGKNITPAELKGTELKLLRQICDEGLIAAAKLLKVQVIIAIGNFAERRAQVAVQNGNLPICVVRIPHPSPRAFVYQEWKMKVVQKLLDHDLLQLFTR